MSYLSEQLDRLLALPPDCGQTANLDVLKRFPVVFWGASDLGREALRLTRGPINVVAFADSDPCKWGKTFEGLPVLSPHEAKTRYRLGSFVTTIYNSIPLRRKFQNEGGYHAVSFPQLLLSLPSCLPFVLLDRAEKLLAAKDEIRRCLAIWSDGQSAEEYVYQIGHRLTACEVPTPKVRAVDLYFPPDIAFRLLKDESFVDCGAYDGDTLKEFLKRSEGRFGSYLAIEPDNKNGIKLSEFALGLPKEIQDKIQCSPNAISDRACFKRFRAGGDVVSRLDESGMSQVECCTLDSLLADRPCTFLKMDIEGAEPDALRGAEKTIRRCKPILAISLYHAQDHLWTIPLWVHDLGLGYRLHLRRHGDDCWETVLYAIPTGR